MSHRKSGLTNLTQPRRKRKQRPQLLNEEKKNEGLRLNRKGSQRKQRRLNERKRRKKEKEKGKGKSGTATVTDGETLKTKPKRQVRRRRFYDKSSSSDEDEVIYEDSSETDEDEYDVLAMRCSECDTRFKQDERRMAVGCDQAHCGSWFHPGCTDLEMEGKTEDEIAAILFTCKYC